MALGFFAIAIYVLLAGHQQGNTDQISYSEFKQQVSQGRIQQITIREKDIEGVYKQPSDKNTQSKKASAPRKFQTYLPSIDDSSLLPLLDKNRVTITAVPPANSAWTELLTATRFDRKIAMELPGKEARRKILQFHTRHVPLARNVDLEHIARQTVGFSGADLQNLINEAALLAGRERKEEVDMELLQSARNRIVLGYKRDTMLDENEKRRVAFHESGHALLACLLPHTDPLERVSIIPRGRSLGATEQLPEEERYNFSESYLKDRIEVMLGGRASEKLIFGETSSGAENDLQQATSLARRMISRWGMSDKLGPVAYNRERDHPFLGREIAQPPDFSEDTARLIDQEVRALVSGLERRAEQTLLEHRPALEGVAQQLVEHEMIEADDIRRLLEDHGLKVAPRPAKTA